MTAAALRCIDGDQALKACAVLNQIITLVR